MKRKHRAALITLGVGVCSAAVFAFLYFAHSMSSLKIHDDIPAPAFVWYIKTHYPLKGARDRFAVLGKEARKQYFTHLSLMGSVHVLVRIPEKCECEETKAFVKDLYNTLVQDFAHREHFEESDVQLRWIWATSDMIARGIWQDKQDLAEHLMITMDAPFLQDLQAMSLKAQERSAKDEDNPLLEDTSAILVFGRKGYLRSYYTEFSLPSNALKRLISRVFFQSSMNEYLVERTFFGERKNVKK